MNIGLQGSETVVNRLRLNTATSDPALATMRLASLLHHAQLHPANLAPAAIVFIRKLYDPKPGSLRLDQSGGHLPALWSQAAKESLDRLVSGAARPALGAVSPSAAAVVFLDRSELLACLATDWCQGSVTTRWWWLSLLRQASASEIVKELWRTTPQYVPAALQQLAKANNATTFVSNFSDDEARSLLQAVARSFELHAFTSALDSFSGSDALRLLEQEATITSHELLIRRDGETVSTPAAVPSLDAPWSDWVPESSTAELRPEQQTFLGISLMLQRAPTKVRTAGFAREFKQWRSRITRSDAQGLVFPEINERFDEGNRHSSRLEIRTRGVDSSATRNLNEIPSGRDDYSEKAAPPDLQGMAAANTKSAHSSSLSQPVVDLRHGSAAVETQDSLVVPLAEPVEVNSDALELPTVNDRDANSLDQYAAGEAQIETEFGGLFYLINLALYLGLYGDFTTPAEPGIELNIWDFVALLGRELVGKPLEDDPVWKLLAQLAARDEGEQPGRNFKPEDEWRMPLEWLKPFSEEGTLCWSVDPARLRLFHSSGFLMLDILKEENPSDQLRREISSFEFQLPSFESREDPSLRPELETRDPKLLTSIDVWLGRLLPYVRARLRKSLDLIETEDPANVLCRQRARIRTTATHVDVYFALSELPLVIRLAGLDRDPGWVPSAGRFVTFHFE
ncbi:MAG: hypothetical protein QOF62_2395 [Pyrinomonadaceae bacterium]|nr:hypothetical protein [Pyrinomonadaceae bacterium]